MFPAKVNRNYLRGQQIDDTLTNKYCNVILHRSLPRRILMNFKGIRKLTIFIGFEFSIL